MRLLRKTRSRIREHTHEQLRERLLDWIIEAGQELHEECPFRKDRHHAPHGYQGRRESVVDGIPLTLSLRVHWSESGRHDGALFLSRKAGVDIEEQRLIRMRTALDKKLPKLTECTVLGDTTFLILEWSDIALSNHVVIGRALEAALAGRSDCPDYVFLADTATEQWHFFQPVIAGNSRSRWSTLRSTGGWRPVWRDDRA